MFDEQDYYSDPEQSVTIPPKSLPSSNVLVPSSSSDFNHLTGEGESLLKIMKDRGFDMTEGEIKKFRNTSANKDKQVGKPKQKGGFFDGGASASLEQLMKALNKAFSKADPQQASCILSYILEKKGLSPQDRNKFGIMKCKILFGLGAYQDCIEKAEELLKSTNNRLSAAILSNYLAKGKAELDMILEGYLDFLRAKGMIAEEKQMIEQQQQRKRQEALMKEKNEGKASTTSEDSSSKAKIEDEFADSQIDTIIRQIDHTELEYNIKMTKYKNSSNLVYPYFPEFRHRRILSVSCGDFHALFLVAGSLTPQHGHICNTTEIFAMGQNTVGQITGRSTQTIFKEPTLVSGLSGKGIKGIWAVKESSLAWDEKGNIYEWGIKEVRDQKIAITYTVGEEILKVQKGYQHYALLTQSKKCKLFYKIVYTWGTISSRNVPIYKQAKPTMQPASNIVSFSCGNSCVLAFDSNGDLFGLGNNEFGQLALQGEFCSKTFKKVNQNIIGKINKVICINDASFMANQDSEIYFCGKISYQRQNIERPRQAQFTGDVLNAISICGTIGSYYLTNQTGELYKWDVDTSVKFKLSKENEKIAQRYIAACHGLLFQVRSLITPSLTKIKRVTQDPRSYEQIHFDVQLFDEMGMYGNQNFVLPPKCQIFLSTYQIKKQELLKENKQFLASYEWSTTENRILLNEIVQSRLHSYKITRQEDRPWVYNLQIISEESGKFYFYVVMEDELVFSEELKIEVSQRQKQLSEKNVKEKQMKEEQRKRRAEMEKQRLLEQKLKKQAEEEQRRKETQRRAEEALRKHMKEEEQKRQKIEEDRKARKELQTGGGFDLSKLKAKNQTKAQIIERSTQLTKTNESFLPDINVRPSSKRKINLPGKGTLSNFDSLKSEKPTKILMDQEPGISLATTLMNKTSSKQDKEPMKSAKGSDSLSKQNTGATMINTKTTLLKRGSSKTKK